MSCQFCGGTETRTTTSGRVVEIEECYLCSRCVQLLLDLPPEGILKLREMAVAKGQLWKAEILKEMIEEESDARQENPRRKPRDIAKHFDRRRSKAADRLIQRTAGRLPARKAAALSQGQPELPALS